MRNCEFCGLPPEVRRFWDDFAVECSQFHKRKRLCFERTICLGATRAEAIKAWEEKRYWPDWRNV